MPKPIFDKWRYKCGNCDHMLYLDGVVPNIIMMKKSGWKYCPFCGEIIDYPKVIPDENKPEGK